MSEVKRYKNTIRVSGGVMHDDMQEHANGDWIEAVHYDRLAAALAAVLEIAKQPPGDETAGFEAILEICLEATKAAE